MNNSEVADTLRAFSKFSDWDDENRPHVGRSKLDREIQQVMRKETWGTRSERAAHCVELIKYPVCRAYQVNGV